MGTWNGLWSQRKKWETSSVCDESASTWQDGALSPPTPMVWSGSFQLHRRLREEHVPLHLRVSNVLANRLPDVGWLSPFSCFATIVARNGKFSGKESLSAKRTANKRNLAGAETLPASRDLDLGGHDTNPSHTLCVGKRRELWKCTNRSDNLFVLSWSIVESQSQFCCCKLIPDVKRSQQWREVMENMNGCHGRCHGLRHLVEPKGTSGVAWILFQQDAIWQSWPYQLPDSTAVNISVYLNCLQ